MAVGIHSLVIATCMIVRVFGECIDSITYSGTLNVTVNGYTCQRWDSQQPHEHSRNTSNYFPNDDSVYDAHNYCRDAGGTYELWCYTTNETQRWDYCVSQEETCEVAPDLTRTTCYYLSRHLNSTQCSNNTLFYLCKYEFGEEFTLISILYDIECFQYSCCENDSISLSYSTILPTTTTKSTTVRSWLPGLTSISPFENHTLNFSMSFTETTIPLSSCKLWTSNCYILWMVLILTILK